MEITKDGWVKLEKFIFRKDDVVALKVSPEKKFFDVILWMRGGAKISLSSEESSQIWTLFNGGDTKNGGVDAAKGKFPNSKGGNDEEVA